MSAVVARSHPRTSRRWPSTFGRSAAWPAPPCRAPIKAVTQRTRCSAIWRLRGRCAHRCSVLSISRALSGDQKLLSGGHDRRGGLADSGVGRPAAPCAAIVITWFLIALAFIDIDHQLLPDSLTLPLLWLGPGREPERLGVRRSCRCAFAGRSGQCDRRCDRGIPVAVGGLSCGFRLALRPARKAWATAISSCWPRWGRGSGGRLPAADCAAGGCALAA